MRFFEIKEFECKCGCGRGNMDPEFTCLLDHARDIAGVPFRVTSGFRCAEHNKNEGGKPDSAHTRGHGSDIEAITSRSRFFILSGLIKAGINRIGIAHDFIHGDNDPQKDPNVIWVY